MNENFALAILTAISITCFAMMIDHARYKKVTNPQHLYRMCEQLIYDALVLSYQELTAYTLYLESQDTDNHTLDFALVNNRIKNQITIRYVVNKRMFNTDILDLSVNNHVLIQNGEQIYHTPVIEDIIPALTAFDPIRFNDQSHIHIDSIDRKNQHIIIILNDINETVEWALKVRYELEPFKPLPTIVNLSTIKKPTKEVR